MKRREEVRKLKLGIMLKNKNLKRTLASKSRNELWQLATEISYMLEEKNANDKIDKYSVALLEEIRDQLYSGDIDMGMGAHIPTNIVNNVPKRNNSFSNIQQEDEERRKQEEEENRKSEAQKRKQQEDEEKRKREEQFQEKQQEDRRMKELQNQQQLQEKEKKKEEERKKLESLNNYIQWIQRCYMEEQAKMQEQARKSRHNGISR